MTISPQLDILETTLRDGNYVVDFQFTAEDTAWMCNRLEECGVRWIEIGHGLGMNASAVHHRAAETDTAYIDAARKALKRAKFGMFAIPGLARLDDIRMAADHGMDFIRIGANVDRVDAMEPFIAEARKHNMFVCTNFMKSYCLPPKDLAEIGHKAEAFGSQMNYVVDSAGGMLPDDVRAYFESLARKTSIPTGFHGHDNIRLAVANSLVAVECGAMLIDTTLFGIGRGSGNAATELIAALLKRRYNALPEIDEQRLILLAEREAAPLLHNRHQELISVSLGLAQVHSMYLERIIDRAEKERVDPHALIASTGRIDRLNVDDGILDRAVVALRKNSAPVALPPGGVLDPGTPKDAADAVHRAKILAAKLNLPLEVHLGPADRPRSCRIVKTPLSVQAFVDGWPEAAVANLASSGAHIIRVAI